MFRSHLDNALSAAQKNTPVHVCISIAHPPRTGELRKLQRHRWVRTVQLVVFALSMLLPMPSAHSDYWADLDNDGVPEQYGDDDGSDTDNDGLKDGFEIYVSFTDPLNWDSNNDGYSDGDEHHQFYGVNYWYSTAMNVQGTVTFSDIDGDGYPNWNDSLPVDGFNGMGDRDADGIWDMFDSYPDDFWNGDPWMGQPHFNYNGTEYYGEWMDSDTDGIPDAADSYPYDSNNGTSPLPESPSYWSGNYMVDGLDTYLSGSYYSWDTMNDSDSDGIYDMFDPYSNDSTNNTSWWDGGSFMIDGNYQMFSGNYYASNAEDTDGDGILNFFDPYANDVSNNTSYINGQPYAGQAFDGSHPETTGAWLSDWFGYPENRTVAPLYLGVTSLVDTDGDLIPDEMEDFFGLDKQNPTDSFTIVDGSGYTYLERYLAWQDLRDVNDPWQYSQMDGIPNMWKVRYGLSLYNELTFSQDPDVDGLDNVTEYLLDTNPLFADTDMDGVTDGAEVTQGSNPKDAASNTASITDSDGDGYSDDAENAAGTNALDPNSYPDTPPPGSGEPQGSPVDPANVWEEVRWVSSVDGGHPWPFDPNGEMQSMTTTLTTWGDWDWGGTKDSESFGSSFTFGGTPGVSELWTAMSDHLETLPFSTGSVSMNSWPPRVQSYFLEGTGDPGSHSWLGEKLQYRLKMASGAVTPHEPMTRSYIVVREKKGSGPVPVVVESVTVQTLTMGSGDTESTTGGQANNGVITLSAFTTTSGESVWEYLTPIEFEDEEECSGLDKLSPEKWLMVPQDGDNRAYVLNASGFDMKVVPEGGLCYISPNPTTLASNRELVAFGQGGTLGDGEGLAFGKETSFTEEPLLRFSVKMRRQIKVAVHPITLISASGGGAIETPQHTPSQAALQDYLNKTFGDQANVFCSVNVTAGASVNWDLGVGVGGSTNGLGDRHFEILNPGLGFSDEENAVTTVVNDPTADVNVYFIAAAPLSPNAGGMWVTNISGSESGPVLGFAGKASKTNKGVIYIWDFPQATDQPNHMWAIAHEIGHFVGGLMHSTIKVTWNPSYLPGTDNELRLMSGQDGPKRATNPRMLVKGEWDKFDNYFTAP